MYERDAVILVPLSVFFTFYEDLALQEFEKHRVLSKLMLFLHQDTLKDAIRSLREGKMTSMDFKNACAEIFPAVRDMDDRAFSDCWNSMCRYFEDLDQRCQQINGIINSGKQVYFVGETDPLVYAQVIQTLKGKGLNVTSPSSRFSHLTQKGLIEILKDIPSKEPSKTFYYLLQSPPPNPHAWMGLLGWVFYPFKTWASQKRQEEANEVQKLSSTTSRLVVVSFSETINSLLLSARFCPTNMPSFESPSQGNAYVPSYSGQAPFADYREKRTRLSPPGLSPHHPQHYPKLQR